MKPQQGHDPFDLDFDADDEFAPAQDRSWRESPPAAAADPFGDPFADLPPVRESARADALLEAAEDDFGDAPAVPPLPPERTPANPVHDMIAGAEAAFGEASLPRITVHIYCANPETAEFASVAAADRRMERGVVAVRMGGLSAAVEAYQNEATPSLVMVESADPASVLLAQLDRLAEVCDPGTKVVVIGSANDIALYRELMRRGVSEYLVPPLNPLLLVRTATSLYADPRRCSSAARSPSAAPRAGQGSRRSPTTSPTRSANGCRPARCWSTSTCRSAPPASTSTRTRCRASPTRSASRTASTRC